MTALPRPPQPPDPAFVPQSVRGSFPAIEPRTRALLMAVRQALLMIVDALEVYAEIERTAELRKRTR